MSCCTCKRSKRSSDLENKYGYIDDPNSPVKLIRYRDQMTDILKDAENEGKLVVIDFFAIWCGPCNMLSPKMNDLAESEEFKNVRFYKVDVDESEELATIYNISCMPTFILFRDSKKIDEFSGANIDKLREMIIKYK